MKQVSILILAAVLTGTAAVAQERSGYDAVRGATEPVPMQRVQADPSAMAMRESQRLRSALGLNDKQLKQVYKTLYNQYKSDMPRQSGFGGGPGGGPGGPRGGMAGGPGGMRGGGPGMGMPGGHSGPGGMQPGERRMAPDADAMREQAEARRKAQARKFRKILTPEQYAAWERMSAELRPVGAESRPEMWNGIDNR